MRYTWKVIRKMDSKIEMPWIFSHLSYRFPVTVTNSGTLFRQFGFTQLPLYNLRRVDQIRIVDVGVTDESGNEIEAKIEKVDVGAHVVSVKKDLKDGDILWIYYAGYNR